MIHPAAFFIKDYRFDKVTMDIPDLSDDETFSVLIKPSGIFNADKKNFELQFLLEVLTNLNKKEIISVRCIADFEFEEITKFEDIPDFFYINSIAILFPYVRSYISIITTQSNTRGIILPTYNLSSLKDELINHTIVS